MYNLLKEIEKIEGVEITEMAHAYRINGIVDLYKNSITVYSIKENKYSKIQSDAEKILYVTELLIKYQKQEPFKKTGTGRVSYQEFKYNSWKSSVAVDDGNDAEDYHWKQNAYKTGDDDLYFLLCGGKIKIGRSKDPGNRIKELSTGLSTKYTAYVFGGKGFMENTLHKCFAEFNTAREWFEDNARLRRFIRRYHVGKNCYRA